MKQLFFWPFYLLGPKPKVTANDLPGGHQFTSDNKDEGPKTIADKHEEQMVQEMDTVSWERVLWFYKQLG